MKIDFVLRSDMDEKYGGDSHQVENYINELTALGIDCVAVPMRPRLDLRQGAIVHLVNTARPFEMLDAFRQAQAQHHPVIVSPIHHSLRDTRAMRKSETNQGIRSLVGRVLDEAGRELIATTVRNVKSGHFDRAAVADNLLRNIQDYRSVWRHVGKALDDAHAVTLLSSIERQNLICDTGWNGRNGILVPNGIPAASRTGSLPAWSTRDIPILIVGRIEPRKRQLEVARIANAAGIRCVFVGGENAATPGYCAEFKHLVDSSSSLEWRGHQPHSEVYNLMLRSRVLINASWVEVQSLVDIEAASAGCTVFCTLTGSSFEHMPRSTRVFGLTDLESLVGAAKDYASADEGVPQMWTQPEYTNTWAQAAATLADVYASVTASECS